MPRRAKKMPKAVQSPTLLQEAELPKYVAQLFEVERQAGVVKQMADDVQQAATHCVDICSEGVSTCMDIARTQHKALQHMSHSYFHWVSTLSGLAFDYCAKALEPIQKQSLAATANMQDLILADEAIQ